MTVTPTRTALSRVLAIAFVATASQAALADDSVLLKDWTVGGEAPSLSAGGSLGVTGYTANANSWTDNAGFLANGAWAHSGGSPWFTFQLLDVATVSFSVTDAQGKGWAPGMTVWTSGASMFNGGTGDESDVGYLTGSNSPHSFNQVGQIGDDGTLWMTGANGNMLETLAYANAGVVHADAENNDWNQVVNGGVNQVSFSNAYMSGVSGSVGTGSAQLVLMDLQPGWYTVFVGGACTACGSSTFDMAVSAAAPVPEPQTWAMLGAGLALIAGAARRRRRA